MQSVNLASLLSLASLESISTSGLSRFRDSLQCETVDFRKLMEFEICASSFTVVCFFFFGVPFAVSFLEANDSMVAHDVKSSIKVSNVLAKPPESDMVK